MHKRKRNLFLCALAMFLLPVLSFGQGLYWESTTSIPMAGDHAFNMKSYYLPRMFKQGSETDAVIFRLDKGMMYSISYADKEYAEITFAEFEAYVKKASDQVKAQMDELKKQMASMPEDQRKMMEQMMGGHGGGDDNVKVDVTKTQESKTISGLKCTKYALKKGEDEAATVWTTNDVKDFASMQKDFREFGQRMASQMSLDGPQMAEAMLKVEGFPVETTISGMTSTVTKVSKMDVAKSEFEVPAGFKKVPFEQMENGHGGGMDEDGEGDEGDDGDGL